MSSAALGVNISLYSKLNYDPIKDFRARSGICNEPQSTAGKATFPAKNVTEFLAFARKEPVEFFLIRQRQLPNTSPGKCSS